jgi:outer membrane protein OmpA-like peptidoglycan-associated protein
MNAKKYLICFIKDNFAESFANKKSLIKEILLKLFKVYMSNLILVLFISFVISGFFSNSIALEDKSVSASENITSKTKVIPNKTFVFSYNNPQDIEITDEIEDYLSNIVKFVKENPNCEIRIVGHSDNTGTFEERQLRSKLRTEKIVRYLVSNGIKREKIKDRFRGAIVPIAPNDTPDNQKKNRRVEIVVVQ